MTYGRKALLLPAALLIGNFYSGLAAGAVCDPETPSRVVLHRGFAVLNKDYRFTVFGTVKAGSPFLVSTTVNFERDDCQSALTVTVPGMDSASVQQARPSGFPGLLLLTFLEKGGSGNQFVHRIVAEKSDGLHVMPSPAFKHSNMGGFFFGDLGSGRGAGAVVWDAVWDSGTHYSPHPYLFSFYRWTAAGFGNAEVLRLASPVEPEPDLAAAAMEFTFKDQTAPATMPLAFP